jgi:hypothetical protein
MYYSILFFAPGLTFQYRLAHDAGIAKLNVTERSLGVGTAIVWAWIAFTGVGQIDPDMVFRTDRTIHSLSAPCVEEYSECP